MDAEQLHSHFSLPGTPTRGVVGGDLEADVTIKPTYLIHKVTGSAKIDTIEPPYEGFAGFVVLAFEGGASISADGNVNAAFTAEPGSVALLLWLPGATSWFGGTLAGSAETPVTTKAREERLERERLRKEKEEAEEKKRKEEEEEKRRREAGLHPDNTLPDSPPQIVLPGHELPDLSRPSRPEVTPPVVSPPTPPRRR